MDYDLPKGYRGVNYPAGKGDKRRLQNQTKYRNNYDQIDWSKGKEPNEKRNADNRH